MIETIFACIIICLLAVCILLISVIKVTTRSLRKMMTERDLYRDKWMIEDYERATKPHNVIRREVKRSG